MTKSSLLWAIALLLLPPLPLAFVHDTPDYSKKFPTHYIYPGDSITVNLIAIDSIGGSVFSQMNASFSSPNSTIVALPGWWIDTDQEISTLYNGRCRDLTYNTYTVINKKALGG